jgi:hypothetical protein
MSREKRPNKEVIRKRRKAAIAGGSNPAKGKARHETLVAVEKAGT